MSLENANPIIYAVDDTVNMESACEIDDDDDSERDEFNSSEIFELIRHLNDPGNS
jgi:hypothetical protein